MKALPGQPVCKHSVSMCFGRAPAPRAHSDSSRAGEGRPGCRSGQDRAGWTVVSGCSRAWHCPSPAVHQGRGQGQGQGRGQADCNFTEFILSRILVATHGFSWLLGGPLGGCPGGQAGEVPAAAWLGVSPAQSLCPASFQPGPGQDSPTLGATLVSALGPGFHQPVLPLVRLMGVSQKKRGRCWLC